MDLLSNVIFEIASENGQKAVVKKLLATDRVEADSKYNRGWVSLHHAAQNGQKDVVQLLLENGAKVEIDKRQEGLTPLRLAAMNGHKAVCSYYSSKALSLY